MRINVSIEVDVDTTDTDIEDMRSEIIDAAVHALRGDPTDAMIDPIGDGQSLDQPLPTQFRVEKGEVHGTDGSFVVVSIYWPKELIAPRSASHYLEPAHGGTNCSMKAYRAFEKACVAEVGSEWGEAMAATALVSGYADSDGDAEEAEMMFRYLCDVLNIEVDPDDQIESLRQQMERAIFD